MKLILLVVLLLVVAPGDTTDRRKLKLDKLLDKIPMDMIMNFFNLILDKEGDFDFISQIFELLSGFIGGTGEDGNIFSQFLSFLMEAVQGLFGDRGIDVYTQFSGNYLEYVRVGAEGEDDVAKKAKFKEAIVRYFTLLRDILSDFEADHPKVTNVMKVLDRVIEFLSMNREEPIDKVEFVEAFKVACGKGGKGEKTFEEKFERIMEFFETYDADDDLMEKLLEFFMYRSVEDVEPMAAFYGRVGSSSEEKYKCKVKCKNGECKYSDDCKEEFFVSSSKKTETKTELKCKIECKGDTCTLLGDGCVPFPIEGAEKYKFECKMKCKAEEGCVFYGCGCDAGVLDPNLYVNGFKYKCKIKCKDGEECKTEGCDCVPLSYDKQKDKDVEPDEFPMPMSSSSSGFKYKEKCKMKCKGDECVFEECTCDPGDSQNMFNAEKYEYKYECKLKCSDDINCALDSCGCNAYPKPEPEPEPEPEPQPQVGCDHEQASRFEATQLMKAFVSAISLEEEEIEVDVKETEENFYTSPLFAVVTSFSVIFAIMGMIIVAGSIVVGCMLCKRCKKEEDFKPQMYQKLTEEDPDLVDEEV